MKFIDVLKERIEKCDRCDLRGRGFAVERFVNSPRVMFIGEAPGAEEEKLRIPFVGRAGKELDRWISFLEVKNYIITNVVKHRPPDNRVPTNEEVLKCSYYLDIEIDYYKPKVLVLLGRTASSILQNDTVKNLSDLIDLSINSTLYYREVRVIVLFHPSYSLRTGIRPPLQKAKEVIQRIVEDF